MFLFLSTHLNRQPGCVPDCSSFFVPRSQACCPFTDRSFNPPTGSSKRNPGNLAVVILFHNTHPVLPLLPMHSHKQIPRTVSHSITLSMYGSRNSGTHLGPRQLTNSLRNTMHLAVTKLRDKRLQSSSSMDYIVELSDAQPRSAKLAFH